MPRRRRVSAIAPLITLAVAALSVTVIASNVAYACPAGSEFFLRSDKYGF
jgi:hypothetical protein